MTGIWFSMVSRRHTQPPAKAAAEMLAATVEVAPVVTLGGFPAGATTRPPMGAPPGQLENTRLYLFLKH